MKTKELIRQLQEADPTGELEVVADDNSDLHFVEVQEAYRDGCGQVLIRNEDTEYYNIIGAKFIASGLKVRLHSLSIADAILDNPDLPVDLSDLERAMPSCLDNHKTMVERWRAEAREAMAYADK